MGTDETRGAMKYRKELLVAFIACGSAEAGASDE
jgi:hypothetical protein